MKIAVVGSGISGLVAAYGLDAAHEVVLFESAQRLGGHTHTVTIDAPRGPIAVDTGFIVFNDWTYPNFIALLEHLRIESRPTTMGFSVHCDRCGLEYSGSSLDTLFAQRSNLLRPRFYRLLADILRFNRWARRATDELPKEMTVGEFLREQRFSATFAEHYLLPMGGAIWSCPMRTFADFPILFILEFYRNHGLLSVTHRPTWRTIVGGSRTYIERLLQRFSGEVRQGIAVERVERRPDGVTVQHQQGVEEFDEVVFACHSDQALSLLADPSPVERELLSKFPYGRNVAVLHTDERLLPQRRKVWSSWNYHIPRGDELRPAVTYHMNVLQHLSTDQSYCVTLNAEEAIRPEHILQRMEYSHPVFTVDRAAAQRRHAEVLRHRRTSYCGAYWGNGFHEDGVNSALAVLRAFGMVPRWAGKSSAGLDGAPDDAAGQPELVES